MNQDQPFSIVDITSVPKSGIAGFHLKYLPTIFSGLAGLKLLELYYEALAQVDDAFGWVAIVDGHTVGFACAIGSKRSIRRRLLSRSPVRLLQWSLMHVLSRPRVAVDLMNRLRTPRTESETWHRRLDWGGWYTYRPLVVDEAYRKYRLADTLTQSVIAEALRRKVPGLISIVERSNSSARVTHIRNGFREVWKGKNRIVFARELQLGQAGHAEDTSGKPRELDQKMTSHAHLRNQKLARDHLAVKRMIRLLTPWQRRARKNHTGRPEPEPSHFPLWLLVSRCLQSGRLERPGSAVTWVCGSR